MLDLDNSKKNWLQSFCTRNRDVFIAWFVLIFTVLTIVAAVVLPIIAYYLIVLADDFDKLITNISDDYALASKYGHQMVDRVTDLVNNVSPFSDFLYHYLFSTYPEFFPNSTMIINVSNQ